MCWVEMIWTLRDNEAGEVTWALPLTLATPWVPHLTLKYNNDMKTKVPDPQRDTQVSSRRGWNKVTKETQNGVCRREKDVCSMCLLCRERLRCHRNRQQGCLTQTQKIRSLGATYTESWRGVAAAQVRIQRSYVLGRER